MQTCDLKVGMPLKCSFINIIPAECKQQMDDDHIELVVKRINNHNNSSHKIL
jgi:hypothetical protein